MKLLPVLLIVFALSTLFTAQPSSATSFVLTPTSGPVGTAIVISAFGYGGTACTLSSSPSGLFSSSSCSISDGLLTGGFTVATTATAEGYVVTVTTNAGETSSAAFTVTATPTFLNTKVTGIVESIDVPQICIPGNWFPYRASANYVIRVQTLNSTYLEQGRIGSTLNVTYSYSPLPPIEPGDLVEAYGSFAYTVDAGCDSTLKIGPQIQGSYLNVLHKAESPNMSAINYHNYTQASPALEMDLTAQIPPQASHLLVVFDPYQPMNESDALDVGLTFATEVAQASGWLVLPNSTVSTYDSDSGKMRIGLELEKVTYTSDGLIWKIRTKNLWLGAGNCTVSTDTLVCGDDFWYERTDVRPPQSAYDLQFDPATGELSYRLMSPTAPTTTPVTPPGPGIPGFSIEAILIGLVGGLVALTLVRRGRSGRSR